MGSTDTNYNLIHLLEDENGEAIPYDDPIWEDLLDQLTYSDLSRLCAVGLRMTVSLESIGKPETLDHNGPSGVTQPVLFWSQWVCQPDQRPRQGYDRDLLSLQRHRGRYHE